MVFKTAGFFGFHTVTDSCFLPSQWPPEDLLDRDRSTSDPYLRRSDSADVALSEKSPYLGGAWVRLGLWQSLSLTGGDLETIKSRSIGDE